MPDIRDQFPLGTTPYGHTTEAPPWLRSGAIRIDELIHDFGAGNGLNGTGVIIGDGLVLTAGHVAAQWVPNGLFKREEAFTGNVKYDHNWSVRFIPPTGSFPGAKRVIYDSSYAGTWNDYAIVHGERLEGASGVAGVRATGSLRPGERVWVVGDKTWTEVRISQGTLAELEGNNARVDNIMVEGGFSGSPVLDDAGNLVGIATVRLNSGDLVIVRTEAIAEALKKHAPGSAAARKMAPALG